MRFNNIHLAHDLVKHLDEYNIPSILKEIKSPVGSSMGPALYDKHYEISIPESEFERANKIAHSLAQIAISNVDKDHYLFDFTNEELQEIQDSPKEWSAFDVQLSAKIIKERLATNTFNTSTITENPTTVTHQNTEKDDNYTSSGNDKWLYIIFIIFLLVASIYSFYSPSVMNERDLILIEGHVIGQPYHYTHPDNPEYISISLEGQTKSFRIKGCALKSGYRQILLNLNYFNQVKFHVSKDELKEQGDHGHVNVYAFNINGTVVFSLDDFNDCRRSTWKHFLMLIPLVFLIMLFSFRKRKNSNSG